ncbi:MAG: ABC transporter ATP-binding protein [Bacillota bacterium]|nr:ABC transporter ATP-binding protein [Bacillota bacterium]
MSETNLDFLIRLEDVGRIYRTGNRSVEALKDINLKIPAGKLVIIKGPSGSGKTTVLNIMGGLDQPTTGKVYFQGKEMSKYPERDLTIIRRKKIGFIFQTYGLIQSFTAYENVELPMRINHFSSKKRREKAYECLRLVGLEKRADHRIFELSGGEQQRVGIARALVNDPELILADEPTGELDFNTSMKVMKLFKQLSEEGVTICMVTHDPAVMEFGDIIYEIIDGRIINEEVVES